VKLQIPQNTGNCLLLKKDAVDWSQNGWTTVRNQVELGSVTARLRCGGWQYWGIGYVDRAAADDVCSLLWNPAVHNNKPAAAPYPVRHNSNQSSVSIFILGVIFVLVSHLCRCLFGIIHYRFPTEIFPAFLINRMSATYPISFLPIVLFGEDYKILICLQFVQ